MHFDLQTAKLSAHSSKVEQFKKEGKWIRNGKMDVDAPGAAENLAINNQSLFTSVWAYPQNTSCPTRETARAIVNNARH